MTSAETKPRDLGDIVGETFRIYKTNFIQLIAIVVIPEAVLYALGYVLMTPVINTATMEIPSLPLFFVMAAIVVVASFVAYALMGGALIHAVSEQSLGRTIGVGRAYGFAWRRLGAMIGAQILTALALIGMSITIIGIPFAIYFGIRWAFIVQAALLEDAGPTAALSRSSNLVKDNWWRVTGIMVVVGMVVVAIGFVLDLTVGLIPYAGPIIAGILPTPIAITAAALLYYDLRVRQEGYNLEAMANELGIADRPSQKGTGPIIE